MGGLSCGGPETHGVTGGVERRSEHSSPLSPSNKERPAKYTLAAASLAHSSLAHPPVRPAKECLLSGPASVSPSVTWTEKEYAVGLPRRSPMEPPGTAPGRRNTHEGLLPWSLL